MTIYLDIYLIINICFDFFILNITKAVIKSGSSSTKLLVSAFIGGTFSLIYFTPINRYIMYILTVIILGIIIIISFSPGSAKQFIIYYSTLLVSVFITGGCCLFILNTNGAKGNPSSAVLLISAIPVVYFLIHFMSMVYERYLRYEKLSHIMKVTLGQKCVELKCLYDTGNNLYEPISKMPVVVVQISSIKSLLPPSMVNQLDDRKNILSIYANFCSHIRLRLIPFNSIGGNGYMLGVIPHDIKIDGKNTKAILGLTTSSISVDKKYDAIINPIQLV